MLNTIMLMGRLTADPRMSGNENVKVARFNLAVDRPKDKDGNVATDFPSVVAFGKQAEFAEKYLKKGTGIVITGRLQTGKYEKDGQTIYTTDVVVASQNGYAFPLANAKGDAPAQATQEAPQTADDFAAIEEDVPF